MVGNKRINTISSLKKRIKAILIILENDDKVTTTMLTAAKKDASLRKEAKEFRKELNKLIKSFKS